MLRRALLTIQPSDAETPGPLFAWGSNESFNLGDSTQVHRSSPVQITTDNFKQVKGNGRWSAGIKQDGSLWVWGEAPSDKRHFSSPENHGSLTGVTNFYPSEPLDNELTRFTSPTRLDSGAWSQVAVGRDHLLALKEDGTMWGLGSNYFGQLGLDPIANKSKFEVPMKIASTSYRTTFFLDTHGQIWGWGHNEYGELGQGDKKARSWPVQIMADKSFTFLYNGHQSTFAIDENQKLWGWGRNDFGVFGQNNTIHYSSPVQIDSSNNYVSGASQYGSNYILTANGELNYLGENTYGQSAQNEPVGNHKSQPVQIPAPAGQKWAKIFTGNSGGQAITNTAQLYVWGLNGKGQLGQNDVVSRSSPVQIPGSFSYVSGDRAMRGFYATSHGSLMLKATNNEIYFVGDNTYGTGATGELVHRSQPVLISSKGAEEFKNFYMTRVGTHFTTSANQIFATGYNDKGVLGTNTIDYYREPQPFPNQYDEQWNSDYIPPSYYLHRLAFDTSNNLYMWGDSENNHAYSVFMQDHWYDKYPLHNPGPGHDNKYGDIATSRYRSSPVQVVGTNLNSFTQLGSDSWIQVSANENTSAAIKSDFSLYVAGDMRRHQKGFDPSSNTSLFEFTEVPAYEPHSWTQIDLGDHHTLALDNDSKLYAWGRNDFGQLGDGTKIDKDSPVLIDSGSWSKVSAGYNHSLAIKNDGKMYAWGSSGYGEVANSSVKIIDVARGGCQRTGAHTLQEFGGYVKSDGTLFTYGGNQYGQLGLGDKIHRSSPTQVMTNAGSWVQIEAGATVFFGRTNDNKLWAWGDSRYGGLGTLQGLSTTEKSRPIQIDGHNEHNNQAIRSWSQVGLGYGYVSAGISNNNLYAWGYGSDGTGATGNIDSRAHKSSPVQIGLFQKGNWTKTLTGYRFGVALTSNGTIHTFGLNNYGQLGLNDVLSRSQPIQVGEANTWSDFAVGGYHCVARKKDGTLWSWGRNDSGEIGDNTVVDRSSPVQISGSWNQVFAGANRTYAKNTSNNLFAWGGAPQGQLGDNTVVSKSSPVQIVLGSDKNFTVLSVGGHTGGITDSNQLWIWGVNDFGQLGNGTTANKSSPVQISGSWDSVSTNDYDGYQATDRGGHTIAVSNTGGLYAWGQGTHGSTGFNSLSYNVNSPIQILWGSNTGFDVANTSFKIALSGEENSGAIDSLGKLWTWGRNTYGTLGQQVHGQAGDFYRSEPTVVGNTLHTFSSIAKLSADAIGCLAIHTNGQGYGWGINDSGAIGIQNAAQQSSPIQIGLNTHWAYPMSWKQLAHSRYHSAGITQLSGNTVDSLMTWGSNDDGQLGDKSVVGRQSPVLVEAASASNWISVGVGFKHTVAVTSDNKVYSWGNNAFFSSMYIGGQRSSPVSINHNTSFGQVPQAITKVVCGPHQTALFANSSYKGYVYTFGNNRSGQLGRHGIYDQNFYGPALNDDNNRRGYQIFNSANVDLQSGTTGLNTAVYGRGVPDGGNSMYYDFHAQNITNDSQWSNWRNSYGYQKRNEFDIEHITDIDFGIESSSATTGAKYFASGNNRIGQLGTGEAANNTTISGHFVAGDFDSVNRMPSRSNAVQVSEISNTTSILTPTLINANSWYQISAGKNYNLAIDANNKIYSWGRNAVGQLGQGTVSSPTSSPTIVEGSMSWKHVSAGEQHALAIASNNRLYAWGGNFHGSGATYHYTTGLRSDPVQMPAVESFDSPANYSFVQHASGNNFHVAIRQDGTLWSWGFNNYGQLGLNDIIARSSPAQIDSGSWSKVFAGDSFAAAINANNKLFMWGINDHGQLGTRGNGSTINRSSPLQVGIETVSYSMVAAGDSFSMGIQANTGHLFAWGENNAGQLGQNNTINTSSPVQIGSEQWLTVQAGQSHVIAIKQNGTLWAWGGNSVGELGDGTTVLKSSPIQIGTANNWFTISSEPLGRFTLALTTANQLYGWGENNQGQIGQVNTTNYSSPIVIHSTSSWTAISAGRYHSMAISTANKLFGWGYGTTGQLGDASTQSKSSPTQVSLSNWKTVDCGESHVLALNTSDELYAWGYNGQGQLGLNNTTNQSVPQAVGSNTWKFINAGYRGSSGILTNGDLYLWGQNDYGQLGDNTVVNKSSPTVLAGKWDKTAMSQEFTLALANGTGIAWSWGLNNKGQLGNFGLDGSVVNRSSPSQVGEFHTGNTWIDVAMGDDFTVAIREDKTMWSWGKGNNGVLGNLNILHRSSPVQIGTASWDQVAAGYYHVVAVANSTGYLYGWGAGANGKIGHNKTTNSSSPVQITSDAYKNVAAGEINSFAIKSDDTLWGWGYRWANGWPGDGNRYAKSEPVQVWNGNSAENHDWKQMAAATNHAVAIKHDGSLWTWGHNGYGELGQNDVKHRSSRVQVGTSTDWIECHASIYGTYAINANNQLYVWGYNNYGQLGTGNRTNYSSPVQVAGSWITMNADEYTVSAINSANQLFSWGSNNYGQVGDGTKINRSSPVQENSGQSWRKVTGGSSGVSGHKLALREDYTLWGWGYNGGNIIERGNGGNRATGGAHAQMQKWQIGTEIENQSYTYVSSGRYTTMAIAANGSMWVSGYNGYGQFGVGNVLNRSSAVQLTAGAGKSWTKVEQGQNFAFGIKNDGTLWSWGHNNYGQLGDNSIINKSSPVQITHPSGRSWLNVVGNENGAAALDQDNKLYAWGYELQAPSNANNALNTGAYHSRPIQIDSCETHENRNSWRQIALNTGATSFTSAVRADGTLWTWGQDNHGQLGHNTLNIHCSSPVQVGGSWLATAIGNYFTIGIKDNGSLWAWGYNNYGQLGQNNINISRSSPVQIGSSVDWKQVSATTSGAAAINANNQLYVWGYNSYGEMGQNNTAHYSSPVQVAGSWLMVSGGHHYFLGIKTDRTLHAWGYNSSGRLGNNSVANKSNPVQIGLSQWGFVDAGWEHSAAIRKDGRLYMWGLQSVGQFGNTQNTTTYASSPVQLPGTDSWAQVTTKTYRATQALRSDGALFVWGQDNTGCHGTFDYKHALSRREVLNAEHKSSPVQIHLDYHYRSFVPVVNKSYAVTFGGTGYYSLDDGITPAQLNRDVYLYRGVSYTFNVNASGHPFYIKSALGSGSTGEYTSGVTNNGTDSGTLSFVVPMDAPDTLYYQCGIHSGMNAVINVTGNTTFKLLNGGYQHIFALSGNAQFSNLYGWGYREIGRIGDTTSERTTSANGRRSAPVQISNFESYDSFTHLSSESRGLQAITANGQLMVWGYGDNGELGQGDVTNYFSPVQLGGRSANVAAPINFTYRGTTKLPTSWYMSSGGQRQAVAIDTSNNLWSWGLNNYGQGGLNHPLNNDRSQPMQIAETKDISFTKIDSGETYSIAVANDGSLWSWGVGEFGQLGLTSRIARSSATQIGSSSWTSVSTGESHALAISSNGSLYAWGSNRYGQLGDNTKISKSSPVLISTSSWSDIGTGEFHSIALRNDGRVFVWGRNDYGQLGLNLQNEHIGNETAYKSSPVSLGTSSFVFVTAGKESSFAIRSDKALFSWGANQNGVLGQDDLTFRSSPVQIGTSSYNFVSSDGYHSVAVTSDNKLFSWGRNLEGLVGDNTIINRSSPVQISGTWFTAYAGNNTTHAITTSNAVFGWGYGGFGGIGDNERIHRSSPVQVATGTSFIAVSSGNGFSQFIAANNTLYNTGMVEHGYLATSTATTPQGNAPYLAGYDKWKWAETGNEFTFAVCKEGRTGLIANNLYGFGRNLSSLVDTTYAGTTVNYPVPIVHLEDGERRFFSGNTQPTYANVTYGKLARSNFGLDGSNRGGNGLAIDDTGTYRNNGTGTDYGELAKTNLQINVGAASIFHRSSPVQIGAGSWAVIASAWTASYAIRHDGSLWSWGGGGTGRLGLNHASTIYSPARLSSSESWNAVMSIGAGAFALRKDGTMWSWGAGGQGRGGRGDTLNTSSPIQIGTDDTWIALANTTGQEDLDWTGAIANTNGTSTSGHLYAWGDSTSGQLHQVGVSEGPHGMPGIHDLSSPVQLGFKSWSNVDSGYRFTHAITTNNELFTWGLNYYGTTGLNEVFATDGGTVHKSSHTLVKAGTSFVSVTAYHNTVGALTTNGDIWVWGDQTQSGFKETNMVHRSKPTLIPGDRSWNHVSAGNNYSAAITSNSELWTWGLNTDGQLGLNDTVHRSDISQVTGTWKVVETGNNHTGAFDSSNAIHTWGKNDVGQLGTNDNYPFYTNRSTPTAIATGSNNHSQLSVGKDYSAIIDSSNGILAWGHNKYGKTGVRD